MFDGVDRYVRGKSEDDPCEGVCLRSERKQEIYSAMKGAEGYPSVVVQMIGLGALPEALS